VHVFIEKEGVSRMARLGKIIGSIEARFNASRLPGKMMKTIAGKPLLEIMVERVQHAKALDGLVVATSVNPKDDVIEALARRLGVACFRGSEEDVMARVLGAAKSIGADHIVELWGDTTLIDPEIIDDAVVYYQKNDFDLVATCLDKTFPWGMSLVIFPTKVLEEIESRTTDPVDRENVSNHIYEHPERYKIGHLPCPQEMRRPEIRLTVDQQQDFDLINRIYSELGLKTPFFSVGDIIELLDRHPDWLQINRAVQQKKLRP
jgi:spore coat polysaccharide biosynthesis protein SpsF